jgi:hypothetical protein
VLGLSPSILEALFAHQHREREGGRMEEGWRKDGGREGGRG